jgi:hypothetical protein
MGAVKVVGSRNRRKAPSECSMADIHMKSFPALTTYNMFSQVVILLASAHILAIKRLGAFNKH